MAVITGATGSAEFTGAASLFEDLDAHIFAFTLNIANDEFDDTDFGTSNASKSTYLGMYTARGSCQAFLQDTTMIPADDWGVGKSTSTVTLTLTASTGRTYAFLAAANNIGFAVDKQTGLNALTFDFISQGTITMDT